MNSDHVHSGDSPKKIKKFFRYSIVSVGICAFFFIHHMIMISPVEVKENNSGVAEFNGVD